jgi:ribosomal subunit interface protein
MKYNIRGKKVRIDDDLKDYVESKLTRLDKYFTNADDFTATIMVRSDDRNHKVEVTIPVKKFILRAEETNKDPFAALDLITDKLERQIRKNKTRMSKKSTKDKMTGIITDFKVEKEENDNSKIVKRKSVELKPMSEDEAVLQMNLIDHEFFVFRDAKTGDIEVVYKRQDGNYGLIKEK